MTSPARPLPRPAATRPPTALRLPKQHGLAPTSTQTLSRQRISAHLCRTDAEARHSLTSRHGAIPRRPRSTYPCHPVRLAPIKSTLLAVFPLSLQATLQASILNPSTTLTMMLQDSCSASKMWKTSSVTLKLESSYLLLRPRQHLLRPPHQLLLQHQHHLLLLQFLTRSPRRTLYSKRDSLARMLTVPLNLMRVNQLALSPLSTSLILTEARNCSRVEIKLLQLTTSARQDTPFSMLPLFPT